MKKLAFALALAGVLAACNVTVVPPGPPPGTPVTVDDDNGVTDTIQPGSTGRFEVIVADEPIRIDVYQETSSPDGDLTVEARDKNDTAYAHTNNRTYFQNASVALQSTGSAAGIGINPPYSLNLPANFGKAYIVVYNNTESSQTVTVKATTRNSVLRNGMSMTNPDTGSGEPSKNYGGAILFLGQKDTYVYNGTDNYKITLTAAGSDVLHLQMKIINTGDVFTVGESATLLNGDQIEVYSQGGSYAGFCTTYPGCDDGLDSGEYTLTISQ